MNKHNVLIIFYIAIFSCIAHSMDITISDLPDLKSLVWINSNRLALASTAGFFILKDIYSKNPTVYKIHKHPTHNLICNQTQSLIGCMCTDRFVVYNATILEEVWSKRTYNSVYPATFGPGESIFVCIDENLYSNTFDHAITLPLIATNNNFGMTCHPTKQKIAYPSHGRILTKRSLDGNKKTKDDFLSEETIIYSILRPIYSPDGTHLVLLSDQEHIHIYNAKDKSKKKYPIFLGRYYSVKFFNESTLALMYDDGTIHFIDYKTRATIAESRSLPLGVYTPENFASIFDFSPHKGYLAAVVDKKIAIRGTPLSLFMKQFVFIYWFMQQHLCDPEKRILPPEIVQLIMQCLIRPHR